MRPPAFAAKARRYSAGFTLIEIMVVTMVIAILVGLSMLSMGLLRSDKQLDEQLTKLSSIIEVVSEEAQMQGRDFGLEFMFSGYRFLEFDPILEVWNEIGDDDLLRTRELEEGLEFGLVLENRRIPLLVEAKVTERPDDEDGNRRDLSEDYLPHVMIMSSGDISPFELELVRVVDGASVRLEATIEGELTLSREDEI